MVAGERNEMQSKFSDAILEMQQKSGLKYLILEKKIAAMKEELEVKEAQLHAVVEGTAPKKGTFLQCSCFDEDSQKYVLIFRYSHDPEQDP